MSPEDDLSADGCSQQTPAADHDRVAPSQTPRSRTLGLILVLALAAYYCGLQNGQWVPVCDADLYVAVARNLALGQGLQFNGLPVRAVPPGWLLFLAGAMKISPSFRFLSLVPACLTIGALFVFYRILLRLTRPGRAFVTCLTVGALSHVYHHTFLLHTEGLFCFITAAAILLALQINEGRPAGWRIPLLAVLCVLSVTVRWAGVLLVPVIAGALLSGHLRPAWNRLWLCAVLTTALLFATFFGLRQGLETAKPPRSVPREAVTYAAGRHGIARRLPGFVCRLPRAGMWVAGLLAEPVRVGLSLKPVAVVGNLMGWGLLGLFIAGLVPRLRRRSWLLGGAALYSLALVGLWLKPCPRYLIPVAPLLLLGLLEGIDALGRAGSGAVWQKVRRAVTIALFIGIGVCNLSLYAVDCWVLQADDFYGRYQAGLGKELIAVARWLNERSVKDGEVARCDMERKYRGVSPTIARLFDIRGLNLLLNRTILTVPPGISRDGLSERALEWARENGVRYYVHRPPISPWQVWHFRVPWLQEWVTGEPPGEPNPYYELYELVDGQAIKIDVPEWEGRIDRVPGL